MIAFLIRILFYISISCLAVSYPKDSQGTPYYGHDFLGLGNKHFKVDEIIPTLENNTAIGVFDSTWPDNFGDPYPKVRKLVQTGKIKLVRVQLYWSYQHKPAPPGIIKQAVPRWERLAKEFPNVIFYLSPSCEYDKTTTKAVIQNWVNIIRKSAPTTIPVLSPMDGPTIPGVLVEKHGDNVVGASALSTDGNNIFDANAAQLVNSNQNATYILGWGMRYNLAEVGNTLKPPYRTAAPDKKYIKMVWSQFGTRIYGGLQRPQLYKVAAEDKVGVDVRANKPLFIIKERVSFIQILDSNNGVMGKFPYYDTYLNQGYRYYSGMPGGMGMYGWEIGELAKQRTGSDVIKIKAGNTVYNVGSAAFRTPYYQD